MVKNKAKQCYVSERKRDKGGESRDNEGRSMHIVYVCSSRWDRGGEERKSDKALRGQGKTRKTAKHNQRRKYEKNGLSESHSERERGRMKERETQRVR